MKKAMMTAIATSKLINKVFTPIFSVRQNVLDVNIVL